MAHSGDENRVGECPFWSAKQTSLAEGTRHWLMLPRSLPRCPNETQAFGACAVEVVGNQFFAADGLMFDQCVASRDVFSEFFSDIEECLDDKRSGMMVINRKTADHGMHSTPKHRPACAQRNDPCF
jgi:hypothetical protein